MPQRQDKEPLISRKQAAKFLDISVGTLDAISGEGGKLIPFYRVGVQKKYRMSEINTWLESNCKVGALLDAIG